MELLLVAAAVIIVIVFALYMRERMMIKKYSELLEEKGKIEKLSKQVQLDYYKRRMTEDTLRKVLADYNEKARMLDQEIEGIEKKHGITAKKTGLERHLKKGSVSPKTGSEAAGLGKMEEEIK